MKIDELQRTLDGAPPFSLPSLKTEKAGGKVPLQLHALEFADLKALVLPERKRLKPWLPEGGLVMIYGPRGVGKTHFVNGLATSLVCGSPFLRWPATPPVGVLIIDGEMAVGDLRDRLSAMLPGTPSAPLYVASHEIVFSKWERDLNLGHPEWQTAVMEHLDTHPEILVVFFDNLACLLPGVAEDKRDDWASRVMPFLLGLRRRGVAGIFDHHAGKGGDQRGTSSREDQLDAVLRLEKPMDHDATQGARFVARFTKNRGVYGEDVAPFEVILQTGPNGEPLWIWKPLEELNADRLLSLVVDGIDSVTDAAEEGLSKGMVSKLKRKLTAEGKLAAGPKLRLVVNND